MAWKLSLTVVSFLAAKSAGITMVQLDHRFDEVHAQEPWEYQCTSEGMGGPQSLWKVAAQQDGSAMRNLCDEGKSLPQLYVLGAPKCGSTSIAIDATNAGVQCAGNVKEYNFWSKSNIRTCSGNCTEVKAAWLKGMPECSEQSRMMVGDFSPKYLSLVTGSGDHPWEPTQPNNLPPVLASVYGDQAAKLVFAVMIREPLSRVHSHWHYSGPNAKGNTFSQELETWLQDNGADFRMATRVWYSSYGAQLTQWLDSFASSQFMVIPYKAYAANGGMEVCGALAQKLGYRIHCAPETAHGMASKHASLDEEASADLQTRFRTAVESDKRKLLRLLAGGHSTGMSLPRYEGEIGSQLGIANWLVKWW